MNRKYRRWHAREQRRIQRRLKRAQEGQEPRAAGPEISGNGVVYDVSEKYRAVAYGGIGAMLKLVKQVGLVDAIDRGLYLLMFYKPYRESDHILNIVFNLLCGGRVLEDIELRRTDDAFLDMLGARCIPDPTTALERRAGDNERGISQILSNSWFLSGLSGLLTWTEPPMWV